MPCRIRVSCRSQGLVSPGVAAGRRRRPVSLHADSRDFQPRRAPPPRRVCPASPGRRPPRTFGRGAGRAVVTPAPGARSSARCGRRRTWARCRWRAGAGCAVGAFFVGGEMVGMAMNLPPAQRAKPSPGVVPRAACWPAATSRVVARKVVMARPSRDGQSRYARTDRQRSRRPAGRRCRGPGGSQRR